MVRVKLTDSAYKPIPLQRIPDVLEWKLSVDKLYQT